MNGTMGVLAMKRYLAEQERKAKRRAAPRLLTAPGHAEAARWCQYPGRRLNGSS